MRHLTVFMVALCFAAFGQPQAHAAESGILRFPDVSATQVVFVHGGDIYTAPRAGGLATHLTTHAGLELFPKFSPDGRAIAFSAEYSGTRQVYVMPSDGSAAPTQLTWYNDIGPMPLRGGYDNRVLDFSPDGKNILVRMNRLGFDERAGRPYFVPVQGGDEVPLAVPETGGGMLSPDGSKLVYTPIEREFRTWKRTRGGRAQDVWIYDLSVNKSVQLTQNRATDNQPMWIGDSIYFTSDRDYTLNLYQLPAASMDSGSVPVKVTNFKDFDVLWPSAGADALVFEQAGKLYLMDQAALAAKSEPMQLRITIPGDRPNTLATIKPVKAQIESADLSANGERVLFSARGELFSVPRKNGEIRQLTFTPDAREMSAAIAPDGVRIAYLSDASGEYELYVRNADGTGEPRPLTRGSKHWYSSPVWAPDGGSILLGSSENSLISVTMTGDVLAIDTSQYGSAIQSYLYTPDSKHVIYVKQSASGLAEIWSRAIVKGKPKRLIGGQFDAYAPAFDAGGRYLYFASNRDHNLKFSSYEFNYLHIDAGRLFAARLDPDAPALFAFKSDEFGAAKVMPATPAPSEGKSTRRIDLTDLENRIEALPIPSGSYSGLAGAHTGLLFLQGQPDGSNLLKQFNLETHKLDNLGKADSFTLSSSGDQLLIKSGDAWVVSPIKADIDMSVVLDLSKLELRIDPKREWPQLYADGLRVLRTWFYDAGMHGQDWAALEKRYAALLPYVTHRNDLDYLLSEIAGELNAGHIYVERGEEPELARKAGGLLGAELKRLASGNYLVEKIFPGQNWSEEFRSPLLDAGVDVQVGDEITAINGQATASVQNFYQLLEGQGGRAVQLRLLRAGKARVQAVKTQTAETGLRYLEWIQSRAAMVNKLSGGRIGYMHLPNTAVEGNRELFKQFPSQTQKEALIIDDRYNGGGFIPDRMIEMLARKPLNYWKRRGLSPEAAPLLSHNGPKAMLTNGLSSSGGDALPYYFRKLNLGLLIGTRTWGGLIGLSGNPRLADGGSMLAATFRFMDTNGKWAVENEGVLPDIEVIDRPELLAAGRDPSLERAVQELLKQLPATPAPKLQAPPAPTVFGRSETP